MDAPSRDQRAFRCVHDESISRESALARWYARTMLRNVTRRAAASDHAFVAAHKPASWHRRCLSRDPWFGLSVDLIDRFIDVQITRQGLSVSTCAAYQGELYKLDSWLQRLARCTLASATDSDLSAYLVTRASTSPHTLSRVLRAMRRFYAFLQSQHFREDNPAPAPVNISWGGAESRSRLRAGPGAVPHVQAAREIRDRLVHALAEATGLQMTDVLDLRLSDLHLESGYMMIGPMRRPRMVLLAARTVRLMEWFLEHSRPALLVNHPSTYVFPSSGSCRIAQAAVLKAYGNGRR